MNKRISNLFISVAIASVTALSARESPFSRSGAGSSDNERTSGRSSGGSSLFSGGRTPSRESASASIRTSDARTSSLFSGNASSSSTRVSPLPTRATPIVQSVTPQRVAAAPAPVYTPPAAERPPSSRIFGGASTARSTTFAPSTGSGSGRDSGVSSSFTKPETPARNVAVPPSSAAPASRAMPPAIAPGFTRQGAAEPAPRVTTDDTARNSGTSRFRSAPAEPLPARAAPSVREKPGAARGTASSVISPFTRDQDSAATARAAPVVREKPGAARGPASSVISPFTRDTAVTRDTGSERASRFHAPSSSDLRPATPNTPALRFGTSGESTRPSRLSSGLSLRSPGRDATDNVLFRDRPDGQNSRFSSLRLPERTPSQRADSGYRTGSSSRYRDGRNAVYSGPSRPMFSDSRVSHNHNRGPSYRHAEPRHHSSYHFDPYAHRYYHHAFTPVWWGPVVYPVSAFGLYWSSGSFGLSFAQVTPSCYSYTRYYDSWYCGGWGYSSLYYGGWSSGWYGGFSYVYNPWPVYRTYYLYEPAPVITRTETVYVTQPATTTYVVQEPATTTYVVQEPATVTTTVTRMPATAPFSTAAGEQNPAASTGSGEAAACFCACRCNGQRPCTCEYPCGSEYAVVPEEFDLGNAFTSYAESLNAETIWSSYAQLDRIGTDSFPGSFNASQTASVQETP